MRDQGLFETNDHYVTRKQYSAAKEVLGGEPGPIFESVDEKIERAKLKLDKEQLSNSKRSLSAGYFESSESIHLRAAKDRAYDKVGSQGFFESDDKYILRANKEIAKEKIGSQGLYETDEHYLMRAKVACADLI